MKTPDFDRYAPVGLETARERQTLAWGLVLSTLWSLFYLVRYFDALDSLYVGNNKHRHLIPGAMMEDFSVLLGSALLGFLLTALIMTGFAVYHYAYHWQGSKSIYLMRRLPDRWELHRRCLAQPLFAILLCAVIALLLLTAYYALYTTATPAQCLPPEHRIFWR